MERDEPSEEEKNEFLKWAHEYSERFNTGYQLAEQLDKSDLPEADRKVLTALRNNLEQTESKSEWVEAMKEGMDRFAKDRAKEKARQQEKYPPEKPFDKDRD